MIASLCERRTSTSFCLPSLLRSAALAVSLRASSVLPRCRCALCLVNRSLPSCQKPTHKLTHPFCTAVTNDKGEITWCVSKLSKATCAHITLLIASSPGRVGAAWERDQIFVRGCPNMKRWLVQFTDHMVRVRVVYARGGPTRNLRAGPQ